MDEVRERVRERGPEEKDEPVEILTGSLKVDKRRRKRRGGKSEKSRGKRAGELPMEKRLLAAGLAEAMVASSGTWARGL